MLSRLFFYNFDQVLVYMAGMVYGMLGWWIELDQAIKFWSVLKIVCHQDIVRSIYSSHLGGENLTTSPALQFIVFQHVLKTSCEDLSMTSWMNKTRNFYAYLISLDLGCVLHHRNAEKLLIYSHDVTECVHVEIEFRKSVMVDLSIDLLQLLFLTILFVL